MSRVSSRVHKPRISCRVDKSRPSCRANISSFCSRDPYDMPSRTPTHGFTYRRKPRHFRTPTTPTLVQAASRTTGALRRFYSDISTRRRPSASPNPRRNERARSRHWTFPTLRRSNRPPGSTAKYAEMFTKIATLTPGLSPKASQGYTDRHLGCLPPLPRAA